MQTPPSHFYMCLLSVEYLLIINPKTGQIKSLFVCIFGYHTKAVLGFSNSPSVDSHCTYMFFVFEKSCKN